MRQFILGLPRDLENAGRLDGLSELGIYWRIVLPLIKPGLVVLAAIIFTDQFMSFVWPLIATTSDDLQLLTVGVAALRAHGGADYGLWSAAAMRGSSRSTSGGSREPARGRGSMDRLWADRAARSTADTARTSD